MQAFWKEHVVKEKTVLTRWWWRSWMNDFQNPRRCELRGAALLWIPTSSTFFQRDISSTFPWRLTDLKSRMTAYGWMATVEASIWYIGFNVETRLRIFDVTDWWAIGHRSRGHVESCAHWIDVRIRPFRKDPSINIVRGPVLIIESRLQKEYKHQLICRG